MTIVIVRSRPASGNLEQAGEPVQRRGGCDDGHPDVDVTEADHGAGRRLRLPQGLISWHWRPTLAILCGMTDVTRILSEIEQGDPQPAEKFVPLVYEELRKLAAAKLAQEKPGQTLVATALVHEAYLRLVGNDRASPEGFVSSRQFFLAAAQAMRRILVERARARHSLKRGGGRERIDLDDAEIASPQRSEELLALDAALDRLAMVEPQAAELVQLRYFAGCTMEEAAELLGLPLRSTQRLWAYVKAWLLEALATD